MNMEAYTPTSNGDIPPVNTPLEWIAPSGDVVRGTYAGDAVWFPEGSKLYIYYTPVFWRRARQSSALSQGDSK